jgi:hypothetical protein
MMERVSAFLNSRSQAYIPEPVAMAGWDPGYWAAVEAMPPMEEEVVQEDIRK